MTHSTLHEDTYRGFSNAVAAIRQRLSLELNMLEGIPHWLPRYMRQLYAEHLSPFMDRITGREHKVLNQIYGALTTLLEAIDDSHWKAVLANDHNDQLDLRRDIDQLQRKLNEDCDYYLAQARTLLESTAGYKFEQWS